MLRVHCPWIVSISLDAWIWHIPLEWRVSMNHQIGVSEGGGTPKHPPTPPATSTQRSQVGGNGKVLYATSTNITFRGSDVSCAAGIWIYIGIPPLKAKLFFQIFCLPSQTWKNFYTHIRVYINLCIMLVSVHTHLILTSSLLSDCHMTLTWQLWDTQEWTRANKTCVTGEGFVWATIHVLLLVLLKSPLWELHFWIFGNLLS